MPSFSKNWIFTLVISALIGLVAIQILLLGVGIRLEKTRLDQKAVVAINEVKTEMARRTNLGEGILKLTVPDESFYIESQDSLYTLVTEELKTLLKTALERQDIYVDFSFTITDQLDAVLLANKGFNIQDFRFNQYKILVENEALWKCRCLRVLHLNVNNLFNYLLSQLAYLIIPSLLFILMLISGFVLLIINLNRQRALDIIKNDFINNLTHELKTPVFSISLTTNVLREALRQNKLEKVKHFLGLIDKENEQLKTHINKVLELASLENGHYNLELKEVDILPIIEETLERFQIKIENKKGSLKIDLHPNKIQLKVDVTHFINILENLLENALKYSSQTPRISVSASQIPSYFLLRVQDNGIGIAPIDQQRIFAKFYRVSTGNIHTVKGFGLGLHYVQQIIQAHGGTIKVSSELGKGATFEVRLPLESTQVSGT